MKDMLATIALWLILCGLIAAAIAMVLSDLAAGMRAVNL